MTSHPVEPTPVPTEEPEVVEEAEIEAPAAAQEESKGFPWASVGGAVILVGVIAYFVTQRKN